MMRSSLSPTPLHRIRGGTRPGGMPLLCARARDCATQGLPGVVEESHAPLRDQGGTPSRLGEQAALSYLRARERRAA